MKDIKGYEGLYAVTSCGKVWGYKRKKFLVAFPDHCGYLNVNLSRKGIVSRYKVHRLVMAAYCPTDDFTLEVNHKDENKNNNAITNLEWVTHKENCNYGTRNERIKNSNLKTYPQ